MSEYAVQRSPERSDKIYGCPNGATDFVSLCELIAVGVHDINIIDFQSKLNLADDWNWDDINMMIENGETSANFVDNCIHQGLR